MLNQDPIVDLLALGGAHVDLTARLAAPHIMGASNPASFSQTIGGGAFNAARVARLRGLPDVGMMSVRGGDGAGCDVEAAIEQAGIVDFSGCFMDRMTPTYTAILEPGGELVTALADMALYESGFERQVRRIEGRGRIATAKALLVDANVPEVALTNAAALTDAPLYAMCISPAKAPRLRPIADKVEVLFLNKRELAALTAGANSKNQAALLDNMGFGRAVISDGANSVTVIDNGTVSELNVPGVEDIVDVTGAGDALTGSTIASLTIHRFERLAEHVLYGIAAAMMTLQTKGPVCQSLGTQAFDSAYSSVQNAQRQNHATDV